MTQSVITSAFEQLKAQEAAGGQRILIDKFVFANIPGLNVDATPPDTEVLPPDTQIVHRQDVDRAGMVNENTVAYSITLPESTGDFTFNWMGLVSSATNTLCMVVYLHPQEKIKTANGKQGNTLVYSEVMEYAGASASTGITTPVSTWQIDFTARLHGMDEATRKAALDIYGPGLFFDDAFRLTASGTGQASFAPGIAYLRGLRVELDAAGTLTYPTGVVQTVYLDAALTGTLTGENKATFTLTSQKTADYTDSLGQAHYVEPVATISASGDITDIRKTRQPLSDRLDGEFLTQAGNLKEIADKGVSAQSDAREHLGLGSSATCDTGTTEGTVAAGDDARITGAMQKDQNGADIPDKQKFIENLGLTGTVEQARNAVPSTRKVNGKALTTDITLTSGDIGALPVTGGKLNGPLGIGTDNALGGNSIVLGDNDTGIKQNADGVLDFYANGQLVARIQPGTLFVINAVQAGDGKKLTLSSNNNSALGANFNLWGNGGDRPTVIELGDDKSWHLYSQRNADGSIQFCTVGQVVPGNYGNFDARYVQNVQRGAPVSPGKIDEYGPAEAPAGCVLTNARHDPGTKYGVFTTYRPLQIYINGWRTIAG
ncbi:phage tail protein [Salmonella enterica subsp. enterica]|nr:phage tail protein [Salmonella enterica]ECI0975075.1 phage tail protein [Salmonella enterica subsp. diarizonae]ECS5234533.1 phage tail protein [Salmonella enterica subsp. enterica serovar Sundsvall]EDT7033866.1 phage tail protein [Salmonella enterica subsp. enterica serovar Soahanina]EBQ3130480.1 phage tail protein [Salmonella enterica]